VKKFIFVSSTLWTSEKALFRSHVFSFSMISRPQEQLGHIQVRVPDGRSLITAVPDSVKSSSARPHDLFGHMTLSYSVQQSVSLNTALNYLQLGRYHYCGLFV